MDARATSQVTYHGPGQLARRRVPLTALRDVEYPSALRLRLANPSSRERRWGISLRLSEGLHETGLLDPGDCRSLLLSLSLSLALSLWLSLSVCLSLSLSLPLFLSIRISLSLCRSRIRCWTCTTTGATRTGTFALWRRSLPASAARANRARSGPKKKGSRRRVD